MSPAAPASTNRAPEPLLRAAVEDPAVRRDLTRHALARLACCLADLPLATREDLASDAVQEAFARAFKSLSAFNLAAGTPVGWLHGILENVLSELARKHRNKPQPPRDCSLWDRLPAHNESTAHKEVAELLSHLSGDDRQIVEWHYLAGISHQDIATRLNISDAASRTRLSRAMARLMKIAFQLEGGR